MLYQILKFLIFVIFLLQMFSSVWEKFLRSLEQTLGFKSEFRHQVSFGPPVKPRIK